MVGDAVGGNTEGDCVGSFESDLDGAFVGTVLAGAVEGAAVGDVDGLQVHSDVRE